MSFVENAISKLRQEGRVSTPESSVSPTVGVSGATQREAIRMELDAQLASRPMVELSSSRLSEAGILPAQIDERRFRAEYRAIKRHLLAACLQRSGSMLPAAAVIMVASALPGEGKTFTSFNLASSLAGEKDWITVLVDADFARGHLTASMGLSGKSGMLDILSDPLRPVTDAIYRTSMAGLLFIPAGVSSEHATELVASDRMKQVVQDLRSLHPRILVVFDSSPLLLTPESRTLADIVGQIVMVVKAESTLRPNVEAAIKLLGEGRNIGIVLNQSQEDGSSIESYGDY